jgi:hypothetical protein
MVFNEDMIIIVINTVEFSDAVYNDTDQKIKQIRVISLPRLQSPDNLL